MSEKYTPDEAELIGCYAGAMEEHSDVPYATAKADAERGIAKIKADALREAAIGVTTQVNNAEASEAEKARDPGPAQDRRVAPPPRRPDRGGSMSDTVKAWIEERRAIHTVASAGPWESGYWYHVQGESHCTCREDQGPLVGIDPHGSFGRMHVHRRPEPIWEEGIRTRDDSTGGNDVVVDTNEYGGTIPEDRAAIVDAHNMFPRTLNALEQVLEIHRPVQQVFSWQAGGTTSYDPCETCHGKAGKPGDYECGCWSDRDLVYTCAECRDDKGRDIDWPCATVQAIEGAISND